MTTALDRLRGMAEAARRDALISTAEADILDRLARVAEDEDDERLDGALEELADNLRRALDRCVGVDDDADDLPSTGCPTCDTVLDTLAECHGMSLRGTTAAEVAESARDWIGDLLVERDEARAEVERLRAEVSSLRGRPTAPPRDRSRDYARMPEPPAASPDADVIAAYTSAPTVGATDAGPDAPALIVEGDAAGSAREARAVPAAPVSGAEQSCGETGVDRPAASDERIVGPREGENWTGPGCHAGTTPYGYRIDPDADEPILLTDQAEAAVMIVVLEGLALGQNAGVIAQRLNRDGSRTRTGAHWTPSSVRGRILSADEWQGVEVGR